MGPRSRSGHSLIQIYSKRLFLTIELKPKTGINIGVKISQVKKYTCVADFIWKCPRVGEMSTGGS